jgi:proline iminopeptidase
MVRTDDGASLWTVVDGEGPAVLLCHGGPGLWDYLGGLSGHLRDELRVHRWDQRGCGRSGPAPDHGLERAVHDVQELHTILDVGEKWVVIGHSWGAYLALLTAVAHPETTAALVYISGNGTPDCWRVHGRAIAAARSAERMTEDDQHRLAVLRERRDRTWEEEVELRRLTFMTDFVALSPPPRELEEMATTPLDISSSVNRALSRAELHPSAQLLDACGECEVPALLLHGSHDPRPDVGAAELSEHLPGARLERIEHAGHLPWVEQPDVTTRLIKDFIASSLR